MGERASWPVYLKGSVIQSTKSYGLSALIASVVLFIVPYFLNYIFIYYVGGVLFLMPIFAPIVTKCLSKEKITPEGKAVFISGCDSGFGHMLAQRLDDLGFHVFAGCLFPDGDGASELRKSGSSRLHVIGLDVTNDDSVQKAADYVEKNLNDNVLWAVVNNAGVNLGSDLHWTNVETIKRVIEVNTFGVVRVTKAFLYRLKQSKGRVVTVASAAGRSSWPGMVPYCMSKSAAISFCEGLRLEMYKWDIHAITIEPWMYRTAILNEEVMKKNILQTWETAPNDVKEQYSANFIDKLIKRSFKVANKYAKPNPGEVVSLMEDAIISLYPEYSYAPGSLESRFSFWLLQRLPKPVADILVFYIMIGKGFS